MFFSIGAERDVDIAAINGILCEADKNYRIQSRVLSQSGLNIVAELKCDDPDGIMKKIDGLEGVKTVSIVQEG